MTKKKKKVPVQKGAIHGDVLTMKSMTPPERTMADSFEGRKRHAGQHLAKAAKRGY